MNKWDYEQQVSIHQEAIRRENDRKTEQVQRDMEYAAVVGLTILAGLIGNRHLQETLKIIVKGKAVGGLLFVGIVVSFIAACYFQFPMIFTIVCAAFCIWYAWYCSSCHMLWLAVFIDCILFLFWMFMRFVVMPASL